MVERTPRHAQLLGTGLAAAGMTVISPDGLLVRLVSSVGAWEIAFYRTLFMGLSLALLLFVQYGARILRPWAGVVHLALVSAVLIAGVQIGFVGAFKHTTVANTLVIVATMPLWSALLGRWLIDEPVRPRTWITMAAGFVGIVILVGDSLGTPNLVGDLMALGVAVAQGLNLVILRMAGNRDMRASLCLGGFLGAAICLPFSDPGSITGVDFAIVAYIGLIQQPLALTLFLSGTRYIPAAEVALLTLLEAVLGPIWAWLGLGEVPSVAAFIGGGIILASLSLNALAGLRRDGSASSRRTPGS